jgi:hypothetical protein
MITAVPSFFPTRTPFTCLCGCLDAWKKILKYALSESVYEDMSKSRSSRVQPNLESGRETVLYIYTILTTSGEKNVWTPLLIPSSNRNELSITPSSEYSRYSLKPSSLHDGRTNTLDIEEAIENVIRARWTW